MFIIFNTITEGCNLNPREWYLVPVATKWAAGYKYQAAMALTPPQEIRNHRSSPSVIVPIGPGGLENGKPMTIMPSAEALLLNVEEAYQN